MIGSTKQRIGFVKSSVNAYNFLDPKVVATLRTCEKRNGMNMWTETALDAHLRLPRNAGSHMVYALKGPKSGPFSAPMRTPRPMRSTPTSTPRMYLPPPPVMEIKPSPGLISSENLKLVVGRLRRPTYVSRAKSLPSRKDWYMERDSVLWNKIPLFSDHKLTMWTPLGQVRRSCKI